MGGGVRFYKRGLYAMSIDNFAYLIRFSNCCLCTQQRCLKVTHHCLGKYDNIGIASIANMGVVMSITVVLLP